SRLAKMNRAGLPLSTKSVVSLNTCPVGDPVVRPGAGGMVTVSAPFVTVLPSALLEYRVEVPVRWLETQNGLVGRKETPQGFFRFVSTTTGAPPGGLAMSETRFVNWYVAAASLRKTS